MTNLGKKSVFTMYIRKLQAQGYNPLLMHYAFPGTPIKPI